MNTIDSQSNFIRLNRCLIAFVRAFPVRELIVLTCLYGTTASASTLENLEDTALDCLIEPWVVSKVGSPAQGVIDTLFVDRGDSVKKGQPLAQLESGVEIADVAIAKIRANAKSEIRARQAELKQSSFALSRLDDLHKQNMVTEQQRDESTTSYQIASAALAQALEDQEIQALELHRTQRQFARRIVQSPIDGVVVAQLVSVGEFIYDKPVMTVATLDPLRIEVMLPARLFGTIEEGDTASLYAELDADSSLIATVDVVDDLLDSHSGTFGIRLKLSNPDNKIPAGQRCRIIFDPLPAAAQPSDDSSSDQTKSGY